MTEFFQKTYKLTYLESFTIEFDSETKHLPSRIEKLETLRLSLANAAWDRHNLCWVRLWSGFRLALNSLEHSFNAKKKKEEGRLFMQLFDHFFFVAMRDSFKGRL